MRRRLNFLRSPLEVSFGTSGSVNFLIRSALSSWEAGGTTRGRRPRAKRMAPTQDKPAPALAAKRIVRRTQHRLPLDLAPLISVSGTPYLKKRERLRALPRSSL